MFTEYTVLRREGEKQPDVCLGLACSDATWRRSAQWRHDAALRERQVQV